MKISDVMTRAVITATPNMPLDQAISLMVQHRVSGLPVVDDNGQVVGMLTEGDLLRRSEMDTAGKTPGWLACFFLPGQSADAYIRTHAREVGPLMTQDVATIPDGASLAVAASVMEARHIKRLPVVRDGRLVGIISRADLLKVLLGNLHRGGPVSDADIQKSLSAEIARQQWVPRIGVSATVDNGVVTFTGTLPDVRERLALRIMAENTPGVKGVHDEFICIEPISGALIDSAS